MKKNIKFNRVSLRMLGALAISTLVLSCTDLEIEDTDSVFPDADEQNFTGVVEPESFIDGMYNSINGIIGDQANTFALNEVTTDAALVPTRGADWGDNGQWRQLHEQRWPTDHAFILTAWNQWNTLHFQAAQVLSDLTVADAEIKANASFLRALGMWMILDFYGQVPVRDVTESPLENPIVLRGEEALNVIISDLNEAIAGLPTTGPASEANNRPQKSGARYLLAKVLLNRHVYLGTTPDNADMAQVISLVDDIRGDGYELEEGYFNIFRPELDNETIWFLNTSVGNRIYNGAHYNSFVSGGGGWNGFSTLAEYYDLFEGDPNSNLEGSGQEERRGFVPTEGLPLGSVPGANTDDADNDGFIDGSSYGIGFLIGQQFDTDGSPLQDRVGNPLIFRRNFTDVSGASNLNNNDENTGIRVTKYSPMFDNGFTNHQIYFRFADAHLMQAEAIFRSGGDAAPLINELRVIRGATPLGSVGAQEILDERGRELYAEHWRRNDLIRFDQYTRDWELKSPSVVGDDSRNLFPIPSSQLILNPNLTQNPGY